MDGVIITDREFLQFRDLIYQLSGISLHDGKRQLVQSRLQKRLRFYEYTSFTQYFDLLSGMMSGDAEMDTFINCITTNKTDFFREPHHFEYIANTILPEWKRQVKSREREPRLRVWHAGCSTGEEPYTLAITLAECLKSENWDVRQLASDIDTNVLAHAEKAIYEADRVAPILPDRLRRHFLRGNIDGRECYKVKPELCAPLAFRQINLLAETWPIRSDVRFDIIFCRNVVIYFDKPTQAHLFARFEERLHPGGYLILGHSESLHGTAEPFETVGHTIYRKRDSA